MHIYNSQVEGAVFDIINLDIESMGYDIARIKMMGGSKRKTLQIMIERKDGDIVKIEDCEAVSRHVSVLMDVQDPIEDHYSLEVSSVGVNRPLTRHKDLVAVIGSQIKLATKLPIKNQKNFIGLLCSVTDNTINLQEVDKKEESIIEIANIHDAALIFLEQKNEKRILNPKNKKSEK